MKQYDKYRDGPLRYLGYANEVGEAFRPVVPPLVVTASYGVATAYVFADAYDKGSKAHEWGASNTRVAIVACDVLIWQMLASVIIPGFTINRITWATGHLVRRARLRDQVARILPTAVGLASIPIIIHPIDRLVDFVMDNTYRKLFN